MNIIIFSNDLIKAEKIAIFLKEYSFKKSHRYDIICYKDFEELIYDFRDGISFDLAFLDNLNDAKILRQLNYNGEIVMFADIVRFTIDNSYTFQVEKLELFMDRFIKTSHENQYMVKVRSQYINIPYNEILYFESNNSKCILHKLDGMIYIIYKNHLDDIENNINDKRFLRCHKSYLVNMDHVKSVNKEFVLINNDIVSIRQRSLKQIRDRYLQYMSVTFNTIS